MCNFNFQIVIEVTKIVNSAVKEIVIATILINYKVIINITVNSDKLKVITNNIRDFTKINFNLQVTTGVFESINILINIS